MGIIQEAREEGIRQGRKEALREGLLEAIQLALEIKFGEAGLALMPEIRGIQELGVLNNIEEAMKIVSRLEEIRPLCKEPPTSH